MPHLTSEVLFDRDTTGGLEQVILIYCDFSGEQTTFVGLHDVRSINGTHGLTAGRLCSSKTLVKGLWQHKLKVRTT